MRRTTLQMLAVLVAFATLWSAIFLHEQGLPLASMRMLGATLCSMVVAIVLHE